jgi:hypothetical protein
VSTLGILLFRTVLTPDFRDGSGSEQVQYRPQEPFDNLVERFFASLRFEQRGKLDEIGFQHDKK